MDNLHKTPEMLALEEQWRKQAAKGSGGQQETGSEEEDGASSPFKIGNVEELKIPSLPAATALLIDMCRDIDVNYDRLSRIIQSDPGLSIRMMRLANSAFYGQSNKISTVVRALTVLGLREVKTIGLSYRLMTVIKDLAMASFDFEAYWERSLVMAVLAKEIVRHMGSKLVDQAFLAGLLQDIGILVLRFNKEAVYQKIADAATAGPEAAIITLERRVFGMDHAQIGALVCAKWEFPEVLTQSIRLHHTPPERVEPGDSDSEMHAATYAASLMPDFLAGVKPIQIVADLANRGILLEHELEPVFARAHDAFNALAVMFDNYLPHDAQIASMMSDAVSRLQGLSQSHLRVYDPSE